MWDKRLIANRGEVAVPHTRPATPKEQIAGRLFDPRLHRRLAQLRFFVRSGQAPAPLLCVWQLIWK
mgnify:CR=1 FL=1